MTKRRTQAERIELSDRKMLDTATRLIVERGTQNTTLKDVGVMAGYSRGLAGVRFGSKEGLFSRMIHLHRQLWMDYLLERVKGLTGLDAILARIDTVEDILLNEPDNVKAMYILWYESVCEESILRSQLEAYNRESRESIFLAVRNSIDRGEIAKIDAESFATAYMSNLFGLVYQWLVSPEDIDLSKSIETLKNYCRFMLKPSENN